MSVLFAVSGSATKRTTTGVKARRRPSIAWLAFTLLVSQCRTKKEYYLPTSARKSSKCIIGRYTRHYRWLRHGAAEDEIVDRSTEIGDRYIRSSGSGILAGRNVVQLSVGLAST
jgi:hypothetical protein